VASFVFQGAWGGWGFLGRGPWFKKNKQTKNGGRGGGGGCGEKKREEIVVKQSLSLPWVAARGWVHPRGWTKKFVLVWGPGGGATRPKGWGGVV